jgi:RNA polymerase sigma factor (TIGR02999 family)
MKKALSAEATQALTDCGSLYGASLDDLIPIVYGELRRLARHYLKYERADHSLQPTALVHEVYLRLIGQKNVRWKSRAHFFSVAAQMMRRILIDHAKGLQRNKRGAGAIKLSLNDVIILADGGALDLIALDEALTKLSTIDPRKSRVVELRYFAGMSVEETAEILGISPKTVMREWAMARAWLYRELNQGNSMDRAKEGAD